MRLPIFLLPFKRFIDWYVEKWSAVLWDEDASMLFRRQKVLEAGFRDHPADLEFKSVKGFAAK